MFATDLSKFKQLLEKEEELTIRGQFDSFIGDMVVNDGQDDVEALYGEFQTFVEKIDSNEVHDLVNSKFFTNIMTFKQNARERELRRLTHDLSYFIEGLGHNRTYYNSPQVIVARNLREVADSIEPRKNKSPKESMNDAWRRELVSEMKQRFK